MLAFGHGKENQRLENWGSFNGPFLGVLAAPLLARGSPAEVSLRSLRGWVVRTRDRRAHGPHLA